LDFERAHLKEELHMEDAKLKQETNDIRLQLNTIIFMAKKKTERKE